MSYEAIYNATREAFDISFAVEAIKSEFFAVLYEHSRPFVLLKPSMQLDGNKWCALYGNNLQEGVAGFGDSPAEASYNFDKAWAAKVQPK